jgi:hypothetical protein
VLELDGCSIAQNGPYRVTLPLVNLVDDFMRALSSIGLNLRLDGSAVEEDSGDCQQPVRKSDDSRANMIVNSTDDSIRYTDGNAICVNGAGGVDCGPSDEVLSQESACRDARCQMIKDAYHQILAVAHPRCG